MKKPIVVKCPMTPNFIETELGSLPIQEFTDSELSELAKEWTEELIKKAQSKRRNNK